MAKCAICGKAPSFGHNVSHANNRTARVWQPAREDGPGRDGASHPRLHRLHQVREGRQGGLT
jgi:large subunit ribosomal protein L28